MNERTGPSLATLLPLGFHAARIATIPVRASAVTLTFAVPAGFFLSVAGMTLSTAWLVAVVLGVSGAAVFVDREPGPASRATVLVVLGAILLGALVPNDVYNKDIVWQISLVDESRFFNTLVLPGFFGTTYTTKYDGWTFLVAGLAQACSVDPMSLVRHANVVLYPALALLAVRAAVLFGVGPRHAGILLLAAVLTGGDAVRLISFAGPRSVAMLFQTYAALLLLEATWVPGAATWRRQGVAAAALLASGVCHNFYAVANTLLIGTVGLVAIFHRFRRSSARVPFVAFVGYFALLAPFLLLKRTAIPQDASAAAPSESTATVAFGWFALVGSRWSEYGSLWPYWIMLLCAAVLAAGRRSSRASGVSRPIASVWVLLLVPLAVVLFPLSRQIIADVTTGSRLMRLAPPSPIVLAWAACAWFLTSGAISAWDRRLVRAAATLAVLTLVPSAMDTVRWYGKVWSAVRLGPSDDRPYYGVTVFLGPDAEVGCPILATSHSDALRLAAILRGHRVYFFEPAGKLRYATWEGTHGSDRPRSEWYYLVARRGDRLPIRVSQPAYRAGSLVVWRAHPSAACVRE